MVIGAVEVVYVTTKWRLMTDNVGMSRVIILRHAKAEKIAETDFARPLSQRGHEQARECAKWLRKLVFDIDHAIVSTSIRTKETWEELDLKCPVTFSDEAYNASAEQLVHLIRHVDFGADTILVIAHNPGVTDLAFANGFSGELTTCSAVVIELSTPASQFGLIDGNLGQIFTPKS